MWRSWEVFSLCCVPRVSHGWDYSTEAAGKWMCQESWGKDTSQRVGLLLQNHSLGLWAFALGGNQEHLISMTWRVMCSGTTHSSPGQLWHWLVTYHSLASPRARLGWLPASGTALLIFAWRFEVPRHALVWGRLLCIVMMGLSWVKKEMSPAQRQSTLCVHPGAGCWEGGLAKQSAAPHSKTLRL